MNPSENTTRSAPLPAARQNVAAVESMYQFLLWLIPVLEQFPRSQKFQLADRMQGGALDVLDALVEAAYSRDKVALLRKANLGLEKLRICVRLAKDLRHLDFKKYEQAARQIDTVGRQTGGWLRSADRPAKPTPHAATSADGVPGTAHAA